MRGNVHVERLFEPTGRNIDEGTAAKPGVDVSNSGGLFPGLSGECAECEGALESKEGHEEEANHEEDQPRKGSCRVIHTVDRQRLYNHSPMNTVLNKSRSHGSIS